MKLVRRKHFVLGTVAMMMAASMFVSCTQSAVSEGEIEIMQRQLDSITAQYEQVKGSNVEYSSQMTAKNQEIEKQAAEINDLLNQLRQANAAKAAAERRASRAGSGLSASSNNDENLAAKKELEKQVKSLKSQIAKLEKQLQTQESANNNSSKDAESMAIVVKAQKEELNANQAAIKAKDQELQAKNSELEKQAKELEILKTELATVKGMVQNANAQKDAAKSDIEAEIARLQGQIASQESQINGLNQEIKTLNADKESMQAQLAAKGNEANAAMERELADLKAQLAAKGVENSANAELERQLNELRQQLAQKEEALAAQVLATTAAEAKVAKTEVALAEAKKQATATAKASPRTINKKLGELQELCDSYVVEIEALRLENEKLKVENEQLHDQMYNLRKDSEQAIADNMKLIQKVELASVLVTNNMVATPGKSIVSGTVVKPSKKAATTNVVRLAFDILDNNVVDPGTIVLYARIANASNRVVCNGNPADYSFDMNGVSMLYTMKQDIEFSGKGRKVVMMWKRAEQVELAAGLYWVTVYANGYEIGKTSFVVK